MNLTTPEFLRDVDAHVMTVFKDDGLFRHIRFERPYTLCMHFDLVTWPGHLCYTGDMGTFVFTRLADMFEFFRKGNGGHIDRRYWAEKCRAQDKADGIVEYSPEKFAQAVRDDRLRWIRDAKDCGYLNKTERRGLWTAIEQEVLAYARDGEQRAMQAAMEFSFRDYSFTDFWDHNVKEFTHRFNWCCMALVWGINKYDNERKTA